MIVLLFLLLLFFVFLAQKLILGMQKSVKECIPLSEPQSFFIKVWYIRWLKLYERVFNDKAVLKKILPSNLIKEMYNLLSILLHFEYP